MKAHTLSFRYSKKGFTLIELLVVIAIIAILAVVVVLTLNPAELLRQSRDANRVSDLATLNSAINLYNEDQGGGAGFSMGSSTVTYISIPDPAATTTAGTNCGGLGFASTGFWCPASSTYRNINGTGWVPINFNNISSGAPFGNLPVDPTNQTSSDLYYSYQTNGTTFRLTASPESQKDVTAAGVNSTMFAAGSANPVVYGGSWVLVPGNSTFGTGNFYVMKYEASCVTQSAGTPLTSPTSSNGIYGYNNGGQNCSTANGFVPSSVAGGYPIVGITRTQAAQYCSNIGAHLMTNAEWQTIAWNAEGQGTNWFGGVVGTNYMYSGHNDMNPNQISLTSADDTQNCTGTNGPASCGGTGSTNSQVRTLTLSNGSVIWDMAGNLYQWMSDTITGLNEPHGASSSWNFYQFPSVTSWGSMTQQTTGPTDGTWSSTQGIGELLSENSSTDNTLYGVIRGGNWAIGVTVTGIETLALETPSGGSGSPDGRPIGFRCTR